MSIVIKEIQVRTTVEKTLGNAPEVTPELTDKLKTELKRELLRMLRKELARQQNKKR